MKYILFFILACSIPLAILVLPMLGLSGVIYKLDIYSPFWIFSLQFGVGLLLFAELFKDFCSWQKNIIIRHCIKPAISLPILFAVVAIAIFISLAWIKGGSRVEADESLYLTTAQNFYHNQIGIHCQEGSFTDNGLACVIRSSIKPRGISYLYMLGMPLFGTELYWVYNFQVFILFLTLPLFFFALLAWLRSVPLALLSTVLLANVPIFLFLSHSSSIEGFYVFMLSLSLLFLKWAIDRNTIRHYILLALTLAFFAQTRSEAVFCLFAFIGVVFVNIAKTAPSLPSANPPLTPNSNGCSHTPYPIPHTLIHSPFSTFLLALSFFSIPILCTLSLNRDSDLQGGSYGAHWHLFENLVENFKIMALSIVDSKGLLQVPFFPYFTWLALAGFVTLLIFVFREFKNGKASLRAAGGAAIHSYRHIALFLLLLSPQYLILFDGVSADFTMSVQQRFVLIVLPAMAFLGALFLIQLLNIIKNSRTRLFLYSVLIAAVTANTLLYRESFKQNAMYSKDLLTKDHNFVMNYLKNSGDKKGIFFFPVAVIFLSHGQSSYGYTSMFDINSLDFEEMQKEYDGEIYIVKNYMCREFSSPLKMLGTSYKSICGQLDDYFKLELVISDSSANSLNLPLSIHRLTGLTERDPQGLYRIIDYRENTGDSTFFLGYSLPKKDSPPWKLQRFVNDSLIFESVYEYGKKFDAYKTILFEKDTVVMDFKIVDTITGEEIHKDYLKLLRKKNKR